MNKCMPFKILVLGFLFINSTAYGTLISFSSDADYEWSPSGAVITQTIHSLESSNIMISAKAYSTFNIKITTTNESGITWTGYILSLDPQSNATFIESTASSNKFNTALFHDAWTLEFQAPQEVLPSEIVMLEFDISIPDDHTYTFNLTQNPIPEPATIVLLVLGSVMLRRKP